MKLSKFASILGKDTKCEIKKLYKNNGIKIIHNAILKVEDFLYDLEIPKTDNISFKQENDLYKKIQILEKATFSHIDSNFDFPIITNISIHGRTNWSLKELVLSFCKELKEVEIMRKKIQKTTKSNNPLNQRRRSPETVISIFLANLHKIKNKNSSLKYHAYYKILQLVQRDLQNTKPSKYLKSFSLVTIPQSSATPKHILSRIHTIFKKKAYSKYL